MAALESLQAQLHRLTDQLERAAERSKPLEACLDRAEEQEALLNDLLTQNE